MITEVSEIAYAKINLTLDVLGKRADGYHELAGVMHSVDLADRVTVSKTQDDGISIYSSVPIFGVNTAYTAAMSFFTTIHEKPSISITIEKNIPSEAGLGGASADAAAVLRALQKMYNEPIQEAALYEIAKLVGADVPFCMQGGCAYATGIGEVLAELPTQDLILVIAKGGAGISTKLLFESLSAPNIMRVPNDKVTNSITACRNRDTKMLACNLYNALYEPAQSLLSEIAILKGMLETHGAISSASMTGSGSAVFGIFDSTDTAQSCADFLCDMGFFAMCCKSC